MVAIELLKKIKLFDNISDHVLEQIGTIARLETFDEESILFRQNQTQTHLFMLLSGKVFLNTRSASGVSLTLDEVLPGRTFGVSALLGESSSTFTAICAETSSIITISGQQLRELFERDYKIGHTLMLKIADSFKTRTEMHTRQFLHSLAAHPEIKDSAKLLAT